MKKKSPRLQLNIRLTPEQNELIKQKLEQTQIENNCSFETLSGA